MVTSHLIRRLKRQEKQAALNALTELQNLGIEQISSIDGLVRELKGKPAAKARRGSKIVSQLQGLEEDETEKEEVCSWLVKKDWFWDAIEDHPHFREMQEKIFEEKEKEAARKEEEAKQREEVKGKGAAVLQTAQVLQDALKSCGAGDVIVEAAVGSSSVFGEVLDELHELGNEGDVQTKFVDFPLNVAIDNFRLTRRETRVLLQGALRIKDGDREAEVVVNLVGERYGKGEEFSKYKVISSQGEIKGMTGEAAASLSKLCSQDAVQASSTAVEALYAFKVMLFTCAEALINVSTELKEESARDSEEEEFSYSLASANGSMCTVKSLDDSGYATAGDDDLERVCRPMTA
eukprot:TRINITY_DN13890_c0_g2_i2.p1 TRINITY_DN13890_c0_g2~~TRINITY_DN13890_c0_g2_i2.p1  ORF type:complete len:349 (+),score=123.29 TRINITY_DN13890_c0_g2_i2:51-1097(+)